MGVHLEQGAGDKAKALESADEAIIDEVLSPLPAHQDIIDWPGGAEPSTANASGA